MACGVATFVFAYAWWQHAGLPYNEEGHHFDGLVNYHQQSVLVYALLAGFTLLLALGLACLHFKTRRR